ncbi:MAG: histidine phosphatase family protein [Clostridia bacterium]|nr:histidine phosphatase family protein [Clostridia bacterium]
MKIIIIRHGDPDYENDTITEKGKVEVECLRQRMVKENITNVYCSMHGRARHTAQPFLDSLGIKAEYCEWLKEFLQYQVELPYQETTDVCWDILPEYMNTLENIYHPTKWREEDFVKNSTVCDRYDYVIENFDKVLAKHGYVRDGYNYKVENSNHDTLVFVCHFGLTAVLLAHLMNCSPYSIWQHVCTLPTSVTTIYTEERKQGIASFRASSIGDISHLYANDEKPSFAARFCECFTDEERH